MVGYWCRVGSLALAHTHNDVAILAQAANIAQHLFVVVVVCVMAVNKSSFVQLNALSDPGVAAVLQSHRRESFLRVRFKDCRW